jgi:hypothetical protein
MIPAQAEFQFTPLSYQASRCFMDSARPPKKRQAKKAVPQKTVPKKRRGKELPQTTDSGQKGLPIAVVPLLIEQGLYCSEQVIAALAISPNTLQDWIREGLPVARRNNQRAFFWGRVVMRFMHANGTGGMLGD